MPMVGGKKFAYTEEGKKEAKRAAARMASTPAAPSRSIKPMSPTPKMAALRKAQKSR